MGIGVIIGGLPRSQIKGVKVERGYMLGVLGSMLPILE